MCVLNSVIDNGIEQWHTRLHACSWATGGHFEYSLWHTLVKTLTVTNYVKIRHMFQFVTIFLTFTFLQGSEWCIWGVVGSLMIISLHVYCRVQQWKNIEINQHLVMLWARVGCPVSLIRGVVVVVICKKVTYFWNSHSRLSRGQTCRVFSQREMQWKWKACYTYNADKLNTNVHCFK